MCFWRMMSHRRNFSMVDLLQLEMFHEWSYLFCCILTNFRIYLQQWSSVVKNLVEIGFSIMLRNKELILWMKCWIRVVLSSAVRKIVSGLIQIKFIGICGCVRKNIQNGETYTCEKGWKLWAEAKNSSWKDQLSGFFEKKTISNGFCSKIFELNFNNSILLAKEHTKFSADFLILNLV